MSYHKFTVGGGETTDERGKSHWPDGLVIQLDINDAWYTLQRLLNFVERARFEGSDQVISLAFTGQIGRLEDDSDRAPGGDA